MLLLTPHRLNSAQEETGLEMNLEHLFKEVIEFRGYISSALRSNGVWSERNQN